jgi:hypothetical protein
LQVQVHDGDQKKDYDDGKNDGKSVHSAFCTVRRIGKKMALP